MLIEVRIHNITGLEHVLKVFSAECHLYDTMLYVIFNLFSIKLCKNAEVAFSNLYNISYSS